MHRLTALALLPAWAIHDVEEWVTQARWMEQQSSRHPHWPIPRISEDQQHLAIALMGGVVASAAVRGAMTRGTSPFYRACVDAYGLHGFMHLGMAAACRGYAPGAATAPLTVIPYTYLVRRRTPAAAPMHSQTSQRLRVAALAPSTIALCHLTAHLCLRKESHVQDANDV